MVPVRRRLEHPSVVWRHSVARLVLIDPTAPSLSYRPRTAKRCLNNNWRQTMFRRTFLALTSAATIASASIAFAGGHSKDIVDTAIDAGSLTTLVAAIQAAGLVDTLKSEGPFTVFAPTDEAFTALPEGTVETLLLPENKDKLISILTYHVVSGKVLSGDLSNNMMAATVQGGQVQIMTAGGVTVDGANVVTADIETSNGVIHVIDAVILPK
jgi:uncharacterized surface protein with fasciclin (FAS1) repeats